MKTTILKLIKQECGGAFVWALLLMMVGSLTLPPLLSLTADGLRATQVYTKKTNQAYAADAGVEDGLWEIKYGDLGTLFPSYDPYDYDLVWTYNLSDQAHGNAINGYDPEVSIGNFWIPKDIAAPAPSDARSIIEDGKLMVTGCTSGNSTYQIKITYNPEEGENDLIVESLGVWLPVSFQYITGSSNLETIVAPPDLPIYYSVPTTGSHAGGQSVVWSFSGTPVAITDIPGVDPLSYPIEAEITFEFDAAQEAINPSAIAWIEAYIDADQDGFRDVDEDDMFSWDADTKIYEITAIAGDARVEAHAAKSEARELGSTIGGDYFIIGNSLLEPTENENYRDRLRRETSATVAEDDIPSSATIDRAYLYWTGWMDWHDYDEITQGILWDEIIFEDDCSNWIQNNPPPVVPIDANWNQGGWQLHDDDGDTVFRGNTNGDSLTMNTGVDLSGYTPGAVTVYWELAEFGGLESNDCLEYYFYDDEGNWDYQDNAFCGDDPPPPPFFSVIINDDQYLHSNFRIRFRETVNRTNEYVAIDDVIIGTGRYSSLKYPDDPTYENLRVLVEETARVNTVMFSGTQVMADEWRIAESTDLPGQTIYEDRWSYACRYDATDLINQWIEDEDDPVDIASNGAGEYMLGHVMTPNEENPEYSVDLWPTGTTGYPLASPAEWPNPPTRHNYCHGGWSLILIYSSAETDGHQLYLFDDTLAEIWHYNPDIDGDGEAGITVDGFLVPEDIITGDEVARITIFAGEGDRGIDNGDSFFFNKGSALSSDISSSQNIWDSRLSGGLVAGIDIDTFTINSPTMVAGDTEAHIDYLGIYDDPSHYYSASDGFTPIYVILSFRSEVSTGGTLDYLLEF